jgi:hypothetical protein
VKNAHHDADYQSGARGLEISVAKPTFGYLSDLGERVGDHALTEIRRLQIAKTKQRDGSGPGARGRLGGPR